MENRKIVVIWEFILHFHIVQKSRQDFFCDFRSPLFGMFPSFDDALQL